MSTYCKKFLALIAGLLCFWFLTYSQCLGTDCLARVAAANDPSSQALSVSLKLVLANGSWIRDTEREGGQLTVRNDKMVLTLSPRVIGANKVILQVRLIGKTDKGTIQFEKSLEIEKRVLHRLSVPGYSPFTFLAEEIQNVSVTANTHQASVRSDPPGQGDAVCCVSCNDLRVCGCAIETPCGGCCAGSCCD